jgi:hypothetical protein
VIDQVFRGQLGGEAVGALAPEPADGGARQ